MGGDRSLGWCKSLGGDKSMGWERSLGRDILKHGAGKEPGKVQEPGRSSDLRGVRRRERAKGRALKGNKGRSMGV